MHRKGFPESYDRRGLMRFVTAVKSGADVVCAPVYSHLLYDIVPGEKQMVRHPDILILEGLNVLQTGPALMVSDLFDFSVYVDARIEDIEHWYVSRFLTMRSTAFADPASHFHHYATLTDEQARLRRPRYLAFHQPPQPDREHPADAAAGHAGAAQGRRPLHQPVAAAQAVASPREQEGYARIRRTPWYWSSAKAAV